jgi:hypothetical protein
LDSRRRISASIPPAASGSGYARLELLPARLRIGCPQATAKLEQGEYLGRQNLDPILIGALRGHLTCITAGLHMWDEVRVFGDDGLIELRRPLDIPLGWQMVHWDRGRKPVETMDADDTPGAATIDFIDALTVQGSVPACTLEDAWLSVRLVELAFESAARGREWLRV